MSFRDPGPTSADVDAAIAAALVTPAWTDLPLAVGWANLGGNFSSARYLVDALGFGHLRGVIIGSGRTIATLPAGSRPDGIVQPYMCLGNDLAARVDVASDGTVGLIVGSGTSYLSFGHLVWRVGG